MISIENYIESGHKVGLDKHLTFQLKLDGWLASKFGLTALGPMGFIIGFTMAYIILVPF